METFNLVRRAAAATGSVLNVLLFGARDDSDGMGGGTDAAPAINAAILALDPLRGGIIEIPYGKYRIATPIHVQRGVTLRGAGGGPYVDPPTQLVADPGVTAIMVWAGGAPDPDSADGGYGAVIERIVITAAGKNTTMQTGSYTYEPVLTDRLDPARKLKNTVTLSSPGDFKNNQMVRVGGVGQASRLQRTTASTIVGSPLVTFNSPVYKGESAGVRVGMWLKIGTAYPAPTKVIAVTGNQVTMGDNAGDPINLTDSPVDYVDDLYARIIEGGGSTTLTLDNANGGQVLESNPNTEVSHGDCGIYAQTRCTIRDVSVGQNIDDPITGFIGTDFVGCGVFIYGDHIANVYSNANGWRLENLFVYGSRHALKVQGVDGNAGKCEQLISQSSLSWAVLDMSFLGNEYSSPQMAGGSGILTMDSPPCRCTIIGAYNEQGTASHFGVGTTVLGGTLPSDAGGFSWIGGVFNRIVLGGIDGAIFTHQTDANPTENWFAFRQRGSKGGLFFRSASAAAEGITGYFVWGHQNADGGFRSHPIIISDFDVSTTFTDPIPVPRQDINVASITGIIAGSVLTVNAGSSDEEDIVVQAIVGTTVTAVFKKAHGDNATVTGLGVSTTFTAPISVPEPGQRDINVASITGITVGSVLTVNAGSSDEEDIVVQAIVGTTVTAVFKKAHDDNATVTGYSATVPGSGLSGGTSGQSAGELWFPQGFWFGEREDLRLPLPSYARKYTIGFFTPSTGNSRQGDVRFFRDLIAGGYLGWACTSSGANPGTAVHTTFGEIVSNDLLVVKGVSSRVMPDGTVMLDENECAHRRIRFSGTLTGNVVVIVRIPAVIFPGANSPAPNSFDKIFQNQTTGAFTLTLKTIAADPGIALAQGKTQHIWSDGMNVFAVAGPA